MKTIQILLLTLGMCLMAPAAYAYLDPGTGSMIIQLIIGALAAASLFFKTFWLRVRGFFGLLGGSAGSEGTSSQKRTIAPRFSDTESRDKSSSSNHPPTP